MKRWKTKSEDEQVTAQVLVSWFGRELGIYRYLFKDGTKKIGTYIPKTHYKKGWELSRAGLLTGGFLVGLLIEWFTRVLK